MTIALKPISPANYEKVVQRAQKIVKEKDRKPQLADYERQTAGYPRGLLIVIGFLLVVVGLAAFGISVGKEIAAADALFSVLVKAYPRLTIGYVTVGIVAIISLSEVGVLLFGLAAHIFREQAVISISLRFFQIACMSVAMLSNITITHLNPVKDAEALDWFITITAPLVFVGIGLIFERLLTSSLDMRRDTMKKYNEALAAWQLWQADPEKHPQWFKTLGEAIFQELNLIKANQPLIAAYLELDPAYYRVIVTREYDNHQRTFNPNAPLPTLPALPEPTASDSKTAKADSPVTTPAKTTASADSTFANLSKADRAFAMIRQNPAILDTHSRQLAEETGINRTTWNEQKARYRAELEDTKPITAALPVEIEEAGSNNSPATQENV